MKWDRHWLVVCGTFFCHMVTPTIAIAHSAKNWIFDFVWLESVLGPEDQRAHFTRCTPSTINQTQIVFLNLSATGFLHYLAGSFNNMTKSPRKPRLTSRELSSVSVDRKFALVCCIGGFVKRSYSTFFYQSGVFEAHGREYGVSIIKLRELYIAWFISGHCKCSPGGVNSGSFREFITLPYVCFPLL